MPVALNEAPWVGGVFHLGSVSQFPARPGRGWAVDTNNTRALADLTLEQLLNETVTSVSKKEQRLGDAAAAIAVLSNDDLQRLEPLGGRSLTLECRE